jgi:tRNA nucleotidyltransferase (CCA-adding enzyme)
MNRLSKRLKDIGSMADRLGLSAYLVGGAVRDLLLGKMNLDLDVVVEGDAAELVRRLGKKWRAQIVSHERFGTFVMTLPDGKHIDFVTARKEKYPRPGILPVVEFSDLRDDLFRRDFTMNALALALNGRDRGKIIDYYCGTADLERGVLRVLHSRSFRDDPTRIFRLARFAGRGFSIEGGTEKLIVRGKKYLQYLSDERIREEILAILSENDPFPALQHLKRWSVLKTVLPGVRLGNDKNGLKQRAGKAQRLGFLLNELPQSRFEKLLAKLKLPRLLKKEVEVLRTPPKPSSLLTGKDLVAMGFAPGPRFKEILERLAKQGITSRREARRFVFVKFRQKM